MSTKKLEDGQILERILKQYRYTASALAKEFDMTPTSFYHITKRDYNISNSLREKLIAKFPDLNWKFLTLGEGPIVVDKAKAQAQENLRVSDNRTLDGIYGVLKNIEALLSQLVEQNKK